MVSFALSKWPHFISIYLVRVPFLTSIAVNGKKVFNHTIFLLSKLVILAISFCCCCLDRYLLRTKVSYFWPILLMIDFDMFQRGTGSPSSGVQYINWKSVQIWRQNEAGYVSQQNRFGCHRKGDFYWHCRAQTRSPGSQKRFTG